MRQICHEHCPKGGGHGTVLLAAAALIVAGAAHTIARAAAGTLEVTAIILSAAVTVTIAAAVTVAVVRLARQDRARGATGTTGLSFPSPRTLSGSQTRSAPRAVEAPRPVVNPWPSARVTHKSPPERTTPHGD